MQNDLMYFIQWGGTLFDFQQKIMQSKREPIQELQQIKILLILQSKLRLSDFLMIGIERLIQRILIIINGHSGYF